MMSQFEDQSQRDSMEVETEIPGQMRYKLSNYAIVCDRTRVSDRTAAVLATSLLENLGLVTPDKPGMVIDRMNIRR